YCRHTPCRSRVGIPRLRMGKRPTLPPWLTRTFKSNRDAELVWHVCRRMGFCCPCSDDWPVISAICIKTAASRKTLRNIRDCSLPYLSPDGNIPFGLESVSRREHRLDS